jgi:hypothetical protein
MQTKIVNVSYATCCEPGFLFQNMIICDLRKKKKTYVNSVLYNLHIICFLSVDHIWLYFRMKLHRCTRYIII